MIAFVSIVDLQAAFWYVGLFAGLLAASFFFSGSETAFFSLQPVDRSRFAQGSRTQRHVVEMLRRKTRLITTILMGNETANVALTAATAGLLAKVSPDATWLTAVLLPPVVVLVSEVTPKVLAFRYNSAWAMFAIWPLTMLYWVIAPARILVTTIVMPIARRFGVDHDADKPGLQEEEFLALLERATTGEVGSKQRDLIEAVIGLDEVTIDRLMTPMPDVFAVNVDITWDGLLEAVRQSGFSRLPIYDDRPDNIIGVLLVKDLLRYRHQSSHQATTLRDLLIPPVFVPASRAADDMLQEFLQVKLHMAFVVDEHGTLRGLVTLDDLLGEIVGDDLQTDESTGIERRSENITVRAAVQLDTLAEETGLVLPSADYHTLGGFVFHQLGRLPAVGDSVHWEEYTFLVTDVADRRVLEVQISPAPRGNRQTNPQSPGENGYSPTPTGHFSPSDTEGSQ